MADQTAQPDTPPRASEIHAEATRELAAAIHALASAIRESASFAGEIEWVPCDEVSGDGDGGGDGASASAGGPCGREEQGSGSAPQDGTAVSSSTDPDGSAEDSAEEQDSARAALQLVPTQDVSGGRPQSGGLCRQGGCRCEEVEQGIGRHERRDPAVALVDEADCCHAVPTGTR